jgi:hypothetical protein
MTLREFYGFVDPKRAAISEHRAYLTSASTQICAHRLLKLVDDRKGIELIEDYQSAYMQYFGMFCENARAEQQGFAYLLRGLMPEIKAEADTLRDRILSGENLPMRPIAVKSRTGQTGQYRAIGTAR